MTLSSVLSLVGKEGQRLGKCHPPLPYLPLSKIPLLGTKYDLRFQDDNNAVWLLAKLPPMREKPFAFGAEASRTRVINQMLNSSFST